MKHRNRIAALVAVATIVLVLSARLPLLAAGLVMILAWSLSTDRRTLRRVAKPKFWIASIIIALLAGLLLGKNTQDFFGVPMSLDGLWMGVMMNLRAFTLVVAGAVLFHTAGREQFMALTSRIGLRHLDPAFATALETLPRVKTTWQTARTQERSSRFRAAARLLLAFADLAQSSSLAKAKCFAITGGIGRGKSTLLRRIADAARSAGIAVGGFSQERVDSGETIAYDLVRWNGERVKIGERSGDSTFRFEDSVFDAAREWLREDALSARLFLMDELGKREAAGGGHVPALQELLASRPDTVIVAVIRKDKLTEIKELFPVEEENVLDVEADGGRKEEFLQKIIETALQKNP